MFDRLTSPFARFYRRFAHRVNGFVNPVRSALFSLLGCLPISKTDSSVKGNASAGDAKSSVKALFSRLRAFKQSLNEMGDFQKLLLLTIAVCLPAGIVLATVIVGLARKSQKS